MRYPELTVNDLVILAFLARHSNGSYTTTAQTASGISLRTCIPCYEVRRSLSNRLITRRLVERSENREHTVDNPSRKRRVSHYIYRITPDGVTMLQNIGRDLRW